MLQGQLEYTVNTMRQVGHNYKRTAATLIPVVKLELPFIFVLCRPSRTLPMSVVRVVRISGVLPPMLMRPTDDSGFAAVFAEKMRLTASACASHRDGLMYN